MGAGAATAFVRGAVIRTVSLAAWRVGAFVVGVVLVRAMPISDAGRYFFVISLGAFLALVLDFGLFQAISREVPRLDSSRGVNDGDGLYLTSLRTMAVVAAALTIVIVLAGALLNNGRVQLVAVAAVFGTVLALQTLASTYLRVRGRRWMAEAYQAATPLLFLGVVLILVAVDHLSPAVLIGSRLAIEAIVVVALLTVAGAIARDARSRPRARSAMRVALPLWFTGLAWVGLEQADVALLGFIDSDASVGIYFPILRLTSLAVLPLGILFPYVMLTSASMVAEGRGADVQKLYDVAGKAALVAGAPVMAAMFIDPALIVGAIFDLHGPTVAAVARFLTAGFFVHAALGLNSGIAEAVVGLRALATRSLIVLGSVLAADLILIMRFGIEGAAIGNAIGYATVALVNASLLKRSIQLKPMAVGMLSTGLVLTISTLAFTALRLSATRQLPLFLCVFVVTALTGGVAWATTSAADRMVVSRAFRRARPVEKDRNPS